MSISPWALRRILDTTLKVTKPGLPTFLRIQNIDDSQKDYTKFGFIWTPTQPDDQADTGFTDLQIAPPPDVSPVSMHNIGILGTRLQFGAHKFMISHTFVINQMNLNSLTDPYQVWRAKNIIGIVYNQRIFSLESIVPITAGADIISWDIVGNMIESPVAPQN